MVQWSYNYKTGIISVDIMPQVTGMGLGLNIPHREKE
jgi:hypothetical protein